MRRRLPQVMREGSRVVSRQDSIANLWTFEKLSRSCDVQQATWLAYSPDRFGRTAQVRTMFALHRQTRPSATRVVFGLVAVFVLTLGLTSQTAKAQVRIGIGIGGIGGAIGGAVLEDSYRRQQ